MYALVIDPPHKIYRHWIKNKCRGCLQILVLLKIHGNTNHIVSSGVAISMCAVIDCARLEDHCVPVYNDNQCCPVCGDSAKGLNLYLYVTQLLRNY